MFPVFSLVLDKDVKSEVAMLYPELYKDLLKVHWTPPSLPHSFPHFPFSLPLSLLLIDFTQTLHIWFEHTDWNC